jgi:hypothetical protein
MLTPSNDSWREKASMNRMSDANARAQADPSLRLVSHRLQQVEQQARRLFERDADFRDLCDEYEACTESLAHLQAGGLATQGLRNEYTALLLRLERELLRCLEEHRDREES